jgi:uncharacterized protein (TIGR02594 family)
MPSGYEAAQGWLGYGRQNQSSKLNDFLYNGGQNLSIQDRAWCADFVNSTLRDSGQKGTGSGMARSFLNWGQETQAPKRGDIAVFERGNNGYSGHVGYFHGYDDNGNVRVLGGNQSGQVSLASYPSDRLLGFRTAGQGSVQAAKPQKSAVEDTPDAYLTPGSADQRIKQLQSDSPPDTGEVRSYSAAPAQAGQPEENPLYASQNGQRQQLKSDDKKDDPFRFSPVPMLPQRQYAAPRLSSPDLMGFAAAPRNPLYG